MRFFTTASAIDSGVEGALASGAKAAEGRDAASSSGAAGGGLGMAAAPAGTEAGAELGWDEDSKGGCDGTIVIPRLRPPPQQGD
jgi:hypothetical protein